MLLSWNKLLIKGFFQFLCWWCSDLIGCFAGLRVDVAYAGASSPSQVIVSIPWEKTRWLHISSFPGVQMGTNERLRKPDNLDECKNSRRESSFYPLSLFPFLSRNRDPRWLWERTVPKFWFCAHQIGHSQLNISGVVSSRFYFEGGGNELFFFYCFLVLFIVHEFYFFKESVHDGGIKRRVGCDQ